MKQDTLVAWAERKPSNGLFVMASYGVTEPLRLFKTCRRGCCVDDGVCGPMMLPAYWRYATDDEISRLVEPCGLHGWRLK